MNDLISRQAAIDYCYALINAENPSDPSDEWNYSQERINQTEVILHHLEFMPSAQPESEERKAESAQNVPIEDLISRKAAIDALDCINGTEEVLRSLPSAQPEPCKDAVSREAAIDVAENAFVRGLLASPDIRRLPSVQPERKTGWWMIREGISDAQCSECKMYFRDVYDMDNSDAFCRQCGTKMEGLKVVEDE